MFRVTDCPAIHSGGYHFQFDASQGNMGYIVPHWLDGPHSLISDDRLRQLPQSELIRGLLRDGTCIALPFKRAFDTAALLRNFHEVHESLLLFLNRLQRLVIADLRPGAGPGAIKVMTREDRPNGIVRVRCNTAVTDWLVVKQRLSPPAHIRRDGVAVTSTEVCIAFPLPADMMMDKTVAPLPQQQVCARSAHQPSHKVPVVEKGGGGSWVLQRKDVLERLTPPPPEDQSDHSGKKRNLPPTDYRAESPTLFFASLTLLSLCCFSREYKSLN